MEYDMEYKVTETYMKTYSVYLAGPISGCSYKETVDWRNYMTDKLHGSIECFSPMRCKEYLATEEAISDSYETTVFSSQRGLFARDRFDVERCDLLFANLEGARIASIGTVAEIAWAHMLHKPIVLVMEKKVIFMTMHLSEKCVPTEPIQFMKQNASSKKSYSQNTKRKTALLFLTTVGLSLLDYSITAHLISENGYSIEGNPLMRWAIEHTNTAATLLYIKLLGFLSLSWSVVRSELSESETSYLNLLLKIAISLYLVVVVYSIFLHYIMHNTA